jgi:hypothetical protein
LSHLLSSRRTLRNPTSLSQTGKFKATCQKVKVEGFLCLPQIPTTTLDSGSPSRSGARNFNLFSSNVTHTNLCFLLIHHSDILNSSYHVVSFLSGGSISVPESICSQFFKYDLSKKLMKFFARRPRHYMFSQSCFIQK